MSESFDSLQSEYLLEMERARLDREENGDYTKAGLKHFVSAARLQFRLASMSTDDSALRHKQMGEQIIREVHAHMVRLGMIASPAAPASPPIPAPKPRPKPAGAKSEAAPPRQDAAAAPDVSKSAELEDFDIRRYLVRPDIVSVEDAERGNRAVMTQLEWAICDPLAEKFPNLGISFETGEVKHLLLYGPPGTGKTFLCQAAATYLHEKYPDSSAFFLLPCSEIRSKYVGTAEHRIRAVFEAAGQYEHAVICIDEVDGICPRRTDENNKQNYTSALLELIDGVKGKTDAIVILATNFPQRVDPALISRIGNRAFLDYPSREQILAVLSRKTVIVEALGDTDAERQRELERIADCAGSRHFSFRNINVLVTSLQNAMKEKLLRLYPNGTTERIAAIRLSGEEIDKALNSVSSDFNPRDYEELLRYKTM